MVEFAAVVGEHPARAARVAQVLRGSLELEHPRLELHAQERAHAPQLGLGAR
jgi:hypothetical protein